jgi:hypothetical protein
VEEWVKEGGKREEERKGGKWSYGLRRVERGR